VYILVLTIVVLLCGQNLESFRVQYHIDSRVKEVGTTFDYSLWKGIEELLKHKLYALSYLLLIFSGIWPHVKLLSMLGGALQGRRATPCVNRALRTLSSLGKWSFFDALVVALITIVFRVDISEQIPIIHTQAYTAWLQAEAGIGLYLFTASIMCSQILGEIVIRQASPPDKPMHNPIRWTLGHRIGCTAKLVMTAILVGVLATFVIGQSLPCFCVTSEIDFKPYGVPLYKRQLQNVSMSPIDGWMEGFTINHIGYKNRVLVGLSFLLVTVLPCLEVCSLAVLLWFPFTDAQHRMWARVNERINHWACLDVFLAVLFVSHLQVPILASQLNEHFHCSLDILAPSWALFAAVIMLLPARTYLTKVHHAVLRMKTDGYCGVDDGGELIDDAGMDDDDASGMQLLEQGTNLSMLSHDSQGSSRDFASSLPPDDELFGG
jgi:hypothetical protein